MNLYIVLIVFIVCATLIALYLCRIFSKKLDIEITGKRIRLEKYQREKALRKIMFKLPPLEPEKVPSMPPVKKPKDKRAEQ